MVFAERAEMDEKSNKLGIILGNHEVICPMKKHPRHFMKNKSQVIWYLEAEVMLGHLLSSVTAESHAELQETREQE